jgi:hypothetical protein
MTIAFIALMITLLAAIAAYLQFKSAAKKRLTNIERLYNKVFNFIMHESSKKSNFNGLKFWKEINTKLGELGDINIGAWIPPNWGIVMLFKLFERLECKNGDHKVLNEDYLLFHFWNQLVRIRIEKPPTMIRVIQMALNSGQLIGRGGFCLFTGINHYVLFADIDDDTYEQINSMFEFDVIK